ncbi:MAG: COX15/CtaA family protein [Planctomycetota bacterium]|nr:COX15/CtaA family protein [Planctomycetota bacterium]
MSEANGIREKREREAVTNPPPVSEPAAPQPSSSRLHRFAVFAAVITYCATVMGGAVTSSDSSLVDPSPVGFFGSWLPRVSDMLQSLGVFFEHGHRILIGIVGLSTIGLAVAIFRSGERRAGVRRLAVAAVVLLLVPAVLGALTVYLGKSPVISIVHVVVAMLFVASITTLAVVSGPRWLGETTRAEPQAARNLALFSGALVVALYLQIVLGAVPRHATLEFGGRSMVLLGSLVHILWAFVVFAAVLLVFLEVTRNHRKTMQVFLPAFGLLFLLVIQLFLGVATFVTLPDEPPGAEALAGKSVVAAAPEGNTRGESAATPDEASSATLGPDERHEGPTPFHQLSASTHQAVGVLMLIGGVVLGLRALRLHQLSSSSSPPVSVREHPERSENP